MYRSGGSAPFRLRGGYSAVASSRLRSSFRPWYLTCRFRKPSEAIEWVKRSPNPFPGTESEIEIWQVFEADDFGPAFTPEARESEERMRAAAR